MKFLLFDHSGCLNRGCEAIVRSTVNILEAAFPGSEYGLLSYDAKSDIVLSDIPRLTVKAVNAQPFTFLQKYINAFYYKILHRSDYYFRAAYADAAEFARDYDVCLIIGGDTFCYGDNEMARTLIAQFKSLGLKTVLWGCSIGEEDLSEEKIKTLKSLDGIFSREPLTKLALDQAGIDGTRVFTDPAFTLPTIEPKEIPEGKLLGINITPLASTFCEGLSDYAAEFLEKVEKETDYTPLLIPHVMVDANDNNDYAFMSEIIKKANLKRTVLLPDNLSASEYKGYISKCEMLIAARTHATIGAYSSCVPVFALSYSIKARGISVDLFGEEICVKSIKDITSADSLFSCLKLIEANSEEMRKKLKGIIPQKKALAFSMGEALKEII